MMSTNESSIRSLMSTTTVSKLWSACVCEIYERIYSLLPFCVSIIEIFDCIIFFKRSYRKIWHLLQNKIVYSNPGIMDNTLALCLASIRRVGKYFFACFFLCLRVYVESIPHQ